MAERFTLNDWRIVNMMMDDRNMYDQHVIDEVYDKLQSMVEAADEYVKRKFGKEYEVGFDLEMVSDRVVDATFALPIIYIASPSDCIEQSLRSEQPTACRMGRPWFFGSVDSLKDDVDYFVNRVDNLVHERDCGDDDE